jgi:N-acyl-phosphatidylethanolamine-hydrolysing phospholipase D
MSSASSVHPLPTLRPETYTTAHHVGNPPTGFVNPWQSYKPSGLVSAFRTRLQTPKNFVPVPTDRTGLVKVRYPGFGNSSPQGLKATWIGHASFLVETTALGSAQRGIRILLDPVWSDRVGPYGMVGPVRFTPPPCTIDELPEVDAVCISHDHYDHLDSDTLGKLVKKHKGALRIFCGLGVKSVLVGLRVGIKPENVTEMDWWDGCALERDGVGRVELVCSPAQHRSGRTPWNFDGTLWCSWIIKEPSSSGKKLFFAGDTGYCYVTSDDQFSHQDAPYPPCPAFREIGELYGPFDLALLPIGCFKPRSILSGQHSSPEDSLSIHKDVRSQKSLGMHYVKTTIPSHTYNA